jgi:hypothetical protein
MGNNICERMFFTLGENVENLKEVWTDKDFANYTPHAALDDLARESKVKDLEPKCHQDMQRFFVSSAIMNQYPSDMENSKYMSQLSTLIDPEVTQQWGLHEIPHYLENIAQAQKNWSKGYVVSSQINYLIHLFFLSEKQAEAAQKKRDEDREAMMGHVLAKIKEDKPLPPPSGFKDVLLKELVRVVLDSFRDLIAKRDVERITGLAVTIQAALKAIKENDSADEADEAMRDYLRQLARVLLEVCEVFSNELSKEQLQALADNVFKLCFYLGELSLHLHVLHVLIKSGLYARISFQYYEAHPLVAERTAILAFKSPSEPIELLQETKVPPTTAMLCSKKAKWRSPNSTQKPYSTR